jgi:hypothetical protein
MPTRDVIFNLKAVVDPGNAAAFQAMRKESEGAVASTAKAWDDSLSVARNVLKEREELHRQAEQRMTAVSQAEAAKRRSILNPQSQFPSGSSPASSPTPAPTPSPISGSGSGLGGITSMFDDAKADLERLNRKRQAANEELSLLTQIAMKRAENAAIDKANEASAFQFREREIKERKAKENDYTSFWKSALDERDKEQRRALDSAEQAHTRALGRISSGNSQLKEGLFNTFEGVGSLARGFALLGFVGEEDLQKLVKQLAVIQGGFDLVRGGIQVYTGITKAVEGYRAAVQAAAAAEAASAAVRGIAANAGATGSTAAGVAAAGSSAIGPVAGGLSATGPYLATIAAAAAPFAAAAAALASVAAAGYIAAETLRDVRKYGVGGGSTPGSASESIGNSFYGLSKYFASYGDSGPMSGLQAQAVNNIRQEESLKRQQAERVQRNEIRAREAAFAKDEEDKLAFTRQIAEERAANEEQFRASQAAARRGEFTSSLEFQSPEEKRKAYEGRIGELGSGRSGLAGNELRESLEEEMQARRAIFQIREEELKLAQQTNQKALEASKQELSTIQQIVKAREDSLKTAAERFADYDSSQQASIIRAVMKAREGAELGRDDRNLLRQAGTDEATGLARASAIAEAEREGFGTIAGKDRKALVDLRKEADRIKAEIDTKVEVEGTVKLQTDGLRKEIRDALADFPRQFREIAEEEARKVYDRNKGETDTKENRRSDVGRGLLN